MAEKLDKIELEIVTPTKLLFSESADMVVIPGGEGDFGVLVGHAPLLSKVRAGTIDIYKDDKILLGRQKVWPSGMYSTLAGFVETGETIENAVRREVLEEAGIKIKNIQYHSSQPWPFPASVMLGFYAEASSTKIKLDENEVEDVQWFSRKEVINFSHQNKFLPRKISIARRLIDDWTNEQ